MESQTKLENEKSFEDFEIPSTENTKLSFEDFESLMEELKAQNDLDTIENIPNDYDAQGNPIYIPPHLDELGD